MQPDVAQSPQTKPVMDFAGNPSCESCFDAGAYKTLGGQVSPHLAQTGFQTSVSLRPVQSKWGSTRSAAVSRPAVQSSTSPTPRNGPSETATAWRVRAQREKSPMVPTFDELGDRLRGVGISESPCSGSAKPAASPWTRPSPVTLAPRPPSSNETSSQSRSPTRLASPHNTPSFVKTSDRVESTAARPLSESSASKQVCAECRQLLTEGEFVSLPSTGEVLHRECFKCGGCRQLLPAGRHVEAEGKVWHHQVSGVRL